MEKGKGKGKGKGVTFNRLVKIHVFDDDTVRSTFPRSGNKFRDSEKMSLDMGFPPPLTFGGQRRDSETVWAASGAQTAAMATLNSKVADIVVVKYNDDLRRRNEVNPRSAYTWLLKKLREVVAKLVDGDVAWLQENACDFYRLMHSDGEAECATPLQVTAFVMDKLSK
jgi:hypothetical protein